MCTESENDCMIDGFDGSNFTFQELPHDTLNIIIKHIQKDDPFAVTALLCTSNRVLKHMSAFLDVAQLRQQTNEFTYTKEFHFRIGIDKLLHMYQKAISTTAVVCLASIIVVSLSLLVTSSDYLVVGLFGLGMSMIVVFAVCFWWICSCRCASNFFDELNWYKVSRVVLTAGTSPRLMLEEEHHFACTHKCQVMYGNFVDNTADIKATKSVSDGNFCSTYIFSVHKNNKSSPGPSVSMTIRDENIAVFTLKNNIPLTNIPPRFEGRDNGQLEWTH